MNEHKHFHLTAKGYYFALILCAALIGAAGFLFRQNAAARAAARAQAASAQVSEEAESEVVSVMAPQALQVEPVVAPTIVAEPIHQGINNASPVDGKAIAFDKAGGL